MASAMLGTLTNPGGEHQAEDFADGAAGEAVQSGRDCQPGQRMAAGLVVVRVPWADAVSLMFGAMVRCVASIAHWSASSSAASSSPSWVRRHRCHQALPI